MRKSMENYFRVLIVCVAIVSVGYADNCIVKSTTGTCDGSNYMGPTPPAACNVGDTWFDTDATSNQFYLLCTATNTWTSTMGRVMQDEGGDLAYLPILNFTGAGVTCSNAASTTTCDIPGGGGLSDGDKGEITVTGGVWTVDSGVVDFSELSGSAADSQIPNNITVDLATTATTANAGDSATAFFPSGTIEDARLSANVSLLGSSISDAEVDNNITVTGMPVKLTANASLDFADPSASTCTAAQTITLTGAVAGEPVILGIPSTITINANQFFPTPVVTATNTVSIKFCEGATVTNNPAAGTFTVTVIH